MQKGMQILSLYCFDAILPWCPIKMRNFHYNESCLFCSLLFFQKVEFFREDGCKQHYILYSRLSGALVLKKETGYRRTPCLTLIQKS